MTAQKNRLLLPLIIAAACSVVAFGGIGVAAITGHLSITHANLNPFSSFNKFPSSGLIQAPVVSPDRHEGFTRNRGEMLAEGKPVNYQFGARLPARKVACPDCGVVDSISPGTAKPAVPGFTRSLATASEGVYILKVVGNGTQRQDAGNANTAGFVVRVHMENGTTRTIYETERPAFNVGERIKLVNGAVIRLG